MFLIIISAIIATGYSVPCLYAAVGAWDQNNFVRRLDGICEHTTNGQGEIVGNHIRECTVNGDARWAWWKTVTNCTGVGTTFDKVEPGGCQSAPLTDAICLAADMDGCSFDTDLLNACGCEPGITIGAAAKCPPPVNSVGTRDCSVLAIDEFLLQCSNEFSAQTVSVSDLDSRITASETNLNQQISNNTDDIIQLQTDLQNGNTGTAQQIADLQSGIVDVNARIDLFAAKAPVMGMIDGSHSNDNNFGIAFKDLFIILLLVSNLGVMCYIHCYKGESVKKTVILDEI